MKNRMQLQNAYPALWRTAVQLLALAAVVAAVVHTSFRPDLAIVAASRSYVAAAPAPDSLLSPAGLPWAAIVLFSLSLSALLTTDSSAGARRRLKSSLAQLAHVLLCALAVYGACYLPDRSTETMSGRVAVVVATLVATVLAASAPAVRGGFLLEDGARGAQIFITERWLRRALFAALLLPIALFALWSAINTSALSVLAALAIIWVGWSLILGALPCGAADQAADPIRQSLRAGAVGALYGFVWFGRQLSGAAPFMANLAIAAVVATIAVACIRRRRTAIESDVVSARSRPSVFVCLPGELRPLSIAQSLPILCPALFSLMHRIASAAKVVGQINVSIGKPGPSGQTLAQPARTCPKLTTMHVLADLGLVADRQEFWRGNGA